MSFSLSLSLSLLSETCLARSATSNSDELQRRRKRRRSRRGRGRRRRDHRCEASSTNQLSLCSFLSSSSLHCLCLLLEYHFNVALQVFYYFKEAKSNKERRGRRHLKESVRLLISPGKVHLGRVQSSSRFRRKNTDFNLLNHKFSLKGFTRFPKK